MIEVKVRTDAIEKILNQGLRVISEMNLSVGDSIRMTEVVGDPRHDHDATGRAFFAKVKHEVADGSYQIELAPFMEGINDETGKPERIPMAGEFGNEKYVTPEGKWENWQLAVKGEKPIWIYKGVKWIQELSLSKFFWSGPSEKDLSTNRTYPPHTLHLKIQGQGGESTFKYVIADEVRG